MPKEKDSKERLHDTLFQSMQQQPISEEEADRLRDHREGFERAATADELREKLEEAEEEEPERQ